MVDRSQSLAVGLAVGIPSVLILTVSFILWYRQQQKLKREDLQDVESDHDLTFHNLNDELHNSNLTLQRKEVSGEGPNGSNSKLSQKLESSSSDTEVERVNVEQEKRDTDEGDQTVLTSHNSGELDDTNIEASSMESSRNETSFVPARPGPVHSASNSSNLSQSYTTSNGGGANSLQQSINHQRTPSKAFDFYDTMIPVLPTNESSSLHDFAKRITTPYFEKLPSGAGVANPNSSSHHSTPMGSRRGSGFFHDKPRSINSPIRRNNSTEILNHYDSDALSTSSNVTGIVAAGGNVINNDLFGANLNNSNTNIHNASNAPSNANSNSKNMKNAINQLQNDSPFDDRYTSNDYLPDETDELEMTVDSDQPDHPYKGLVGKKED